MDSKQKPKIKLFLALGALLFLQCCCCVIPVRWRTDVNTPAPAVAPAPARPVEPVACQPPGAGNPANQECLKTGSGWMEGGFTTFQPILLVFSHCGPAREHIQSDFRIL